MTDAEQEWSNYKYQLQQVEAALDLNPDDEELQRLKADLEDMIQLTQHMLTSSKSNNNNNNNNNSGNSGTGSRKNATTTATATTTSLKAPTSTTTTTSASTTTTTTATPLFQIGDVVEAKYSGDGKYYEARIEGINPSTQLYTVLFTGYGSSEFVSKDQLRPPRQTTTKKTYAGTHLYQHHTPAAPLAAPTPAAATQAGGPMKKKKATREERVAKKDAVLQSKQDSWRTFHQKAMKKKSSLVTKKSIFATGDLPTSRVGVTGSGHTMTQFKQRGKHVFQPEPQQQPDGGE